VLSHSKDSDHAPDDFSGEKKEKKRSCFLDSKDESDQDYLWRKEVPHVLVSVGETCFEKKKKNNCSRVAISNAGVHPTPDDKKSSSPQKTFRPIVNRLGHACTQKTLPPNNLA
jgi:hypothetical protein